jgi:predicted esterase
VLVGFHGYGQAAEACLRELQAIPGASRLVLVAVQALHRFYDRRHEEVVGSWMTRLDREQAILDNERYVAQVVSAVEEEGVSDGRVVYIGFSQGASMAYRAAAHSARPAQGVIALGGDLPPELGGQSGVRLPPVLIGRGGEDDWYTEEKLADDLERLAALGVAPEVERFAGGHEWTQVFRDRVAAFLDRVLRTT